MQRFFILIAACFALLPSPFPTAADPADRQRIVFLGDFLPSGSADDVIAVKGYSYLFGGVHDILAESDAAFLNLETPLSGRGAPVEGKAYTFRADPAAADAMYAEGIRAVSLANNHILDFGPGALSDTLDNLRKAGIQTVGAGMDVSEAAEPAVVLTDSGSVVLLAFSNTFPDSYWAKRGRPGTLFGSPKMVRKAVSGAAEKGPVIVSFHWGQELMEQPKEYQVNLSHLAIDSGADLVVGHHPHVPQPIEIYRGVPILYSLGNFSFGSYSQNALTGLMARAEFGEEGTCDKLEIYPLLVDNARVLFRPRTLSGIEGQRVFEDLTRGISTEAAEVTWDGEKGVIELKEIGD
jgi:poly-gamma-glutamate synthesis protein (capsule biosynthesis protein)